MPTGICKKNLLEAHVSIPLTGPRKLFPNGDGERFKFKFVNRTGEAIHDLWVVTNGPDIIEGTIKIRMGDDELDFEDGLEPGEEAESVHVTLLEAIPKDAEFSITIEFDEDFDENDEWIRFSPTDEDDATIVADVQIIDCRESAVASPGTRPRTLLRDSKAERAIVLRHLRQMGPKRALQGIEEARALLAAQAFLNRQHRKLSTEPKDSAEGCC